MFYLHNYLFLFHLHSQHQPFIPREESKAKLLFLHIFEIVTIHGLPATHSTIDFQQGHITNPWMWLPVYIHNASTNYLQAHIRKLRCSQWQLLEDPKQLRSFQLIFCYSNHFIIADIAAVFASVPGLECKCDFRSARVLFSIAVFLFFFKWRLLYMAILCRKLGIRFNLSNSVEQTPFVQF